ncbi:tRNA (N6-isopentenyl adenosine(37)-C2)-methylthiotransferase MiaB [Clostridium formicaceticum]|uniref:tRNA-2-methylthio-N(6)-dimethylallyladenosine synthase n=1 Tax=Clostridium formicaceticum TaxID=1497 RepID=A0AAC9RIJ1_9CLOT|nr:tRNA (N6-isopentenyl adenosine(37)-C2)-methylthiotransferase MiaB [Clostridium formicaceticum]AOY77173.1 tRNA (N6-isopentenyl adenosine(37)-C2)-methylthiotransferase MiaB [Clostridium formicaceticum]ARE87694.1 (Dimethylallyl)adenosine tRNA methylthiotransferase MiaB [Clostridium formicaceticum]
MSKREEVKVSQEELNRQREIINKLRKINDAEYERTGKRKKHLTVTYGCQMNEHDSEKLLGMLKDMGYVETSEKEKADLIIYNTCCVRENAELKVYGNLGALKPLKKKNSDLMIAVCGCMMQQPKVVEAIKKKYKHVDLVFGTHNLHKFPELLANCKQADNMLVEVWEEEGEIIEGIPSMRKYGVKAFVNIMFGCNNFCTYCIVPYTRGRERSREIKEIVNEVVDLAKNGTKEITLLGQNVNSYGKTLENKTEFADLLKELNKIDGIERIRFMTSHPKDLSESLIEAIAHYDKVCEHIHLPFQAGSNAILKAMNRNYTQESYLGLVEKLKKAVPDIAMTTDIIVGFPGETEEDFMDTLKVVEAVRFDSAFTFLYSVREGTPAAKMETQVDDEIKHKRFNQLVETVNQISAEINSCYLNKEVEVLVEGVSKTDPSKLMGRTRQNKLVNFSGGEELIGKLVRVKVTEPKTFSLNGEIVS